MSPIPRRVLLQGTAALLATAAQAAEPAPFSPAPFSPAPFSPAPFSPADVLRAARDLARKPYQPPAATLPPAAANLTYDQFRGIAFRMERALWRGQNLPFQLGFFPRGFLYKDRVDIFEVTDGRAAPLAYSPDLFDYADPKARVPDDLGFAGFRIHAEINRPGEFDEFVVFLGASYFRAVGRGQFYGLSARGLAIGTGRPTPEEFPRFRSFWIERPQPGVPTLVVHALLDSPGATGAFRFSIRPGDTTVIDVQSTILPRLDIPDAGIAPLTSMYMFSPRDHAATAPADWRTAVHDTDGLARRTGRDEQVWRPLVNPRTLQTTPMQDTDPRGFGLVQRRRAFEDYGDLQVLYGRRPGAWVEPIGAWGEGAVSLVEIPTDTEYNDNIVAAWRPPRAAPRRQRARLHLPPALGRRPAAENPARPHRHAPHRRRRHARHARLHPGLRRRDPPRPAGRRQDPPRPRRLRRPPGRRVLRPQPRNRLLAHQPGVRPPGRALGRPALHDPRRARRAGGDVDVPLARLMEAG